MSLMLLCQDICSGLWTYASRSLDSISNKALFFVGHDAALVAAGKAVLLSWSQGAVSFCTYPVVVSMFLWQSVICYCWILGSANKGDETVIPVTTVDAVTLRHQRLLLFWSVRIQVVCFLYVFSVF